MQRFLGVALGAVTTLVLLLVLNPVAGDATTKYLAAVIAGAVTSLVGPWLISFYLGRRAKRRRAEQVSRDAAEQYAAEKERGD